ncbi:LysR family transcriptional regulator, partial [Bradyrhizobium sp. SRL28]|uniref:LysR substrate-binding domain-containing protein n=1 Tax=Bradyrhizobium sp. SRL28 TaxID=2836178 RepID=UPI001BDE0B45
AIHVAQPALSQQVGELEERLGFVLLDRSSRGVRPTAAGEIVFREASEILRQLKQLPGIVRSSSGEVEGIVNFGITIALAGGIAGSAVAACKIALPKVTLKFSDGESDELQDRIEAQTLDMALVFEDHFVPNFSRHPIFRQRLYLVAREPLAGCRGVVPLEQVAKLPLVLPPLPRHRRIVIDRAFAEAGLTPNVIAETAGLSELSAVRSGVGYSIYNAGTFANVYPGAFAEPLLIEPPIFLTCSLVSSSDFPLTHAGEAVKNVLIRFVEDQIAKNMRPGAELIG